MRIAIISGHDLDIFKGSEELLVETPYGNVKISRRIMEDREIFFLNRHNSMGSPLPPHKIDYGANIEALSKCKVDTVISIGTVGSINEEMKPGTMVIPHDFIDFTKCRTYTFFNEKRVHIDMSEPFCTYLRKVLSESCKSLKLEHKDRAVYLATEGPRLETPAEIRLFSKFADVVGMTLVPEVVLARERRMCYASICIVCNMAAGLQERLTAREIVRLVSQKKRHIENLIVEAIKRISEVRDCDCRFALEEAEI